MFSLLLSTGQWLYAAVDDYKLIQTSSFNAQMRNRVDEMRLTCKYPAAKYLTTETIPLRFLWLHNYKRPNWVLFPPSTTVVELIKSLCLK